MVQSLLCVWVSVEGGEAGPVVELSVQIHEQLPPAIAARVRLPEAIRAVLGLTIWKDYGGADNPGHRQKPQYRKGRKR